MKTTFTYTIKFIALLIVLASCNTQTIEYYKAKAEKGNAEAQYYLGECYFHGKEIPIDKAKAVEWWQKAAE